MKIIRGRRIVENKIGRRVVAEVAEPLGLAGVQLAAGGEHLLHPPLFAPFILEPNLEKIGCNCLLESLVARKLARSILPKDFLSFL